ncbi:MAG TPA: pyridoxal-phosphate dependent enzyme [bacterium]|nr:pyridoxal-phosphate dependent enzyme [bacterium]
MRGGLSEKSSPPPLPVASRRKAEWPTDSLHPPRAARREAAHRPGATRGIGQETLGGSENPPDDVSLRPTPRILGGAPVIVATAEALAGELRPRIAKIPRVRIGEFPTPLTELTRLSRHLGGPRIFLKREDLSGLALGGNKTRLLEFRLAEALEQGADVVIAGLEEESNSARQLTAAANRLGLRTVLLMRCLGTPAWQGNLLLDRILGAEIHFLPAEADIDHALREMAELERGRGHRPYIMNHARFFGIGAALAGLEWTLETLEQLGGLGLRPTHFYLSSGGKCQSGMVLVQKMAAGTPFRVIGIHAKPEATGPEATSRIANATAEALGLDLRIGPNEVENRIEFAGPAFGISTPEDIAAIRLVARLEGILLDPVFTGKAMAGLLADAKDGRLKADDVVVFVHTGGIPGLFAHAHEFLMEAAPTGTA